MGRERGGLLGARDQSMLDGKLVIEDDDRFRIESPGSDGRAKSVSQSIFDWR